MPNLAYMTVNMLYLLTLAIWVGGIIAFAALFVPALSGVLERGQTGQVIAAFLVRFQRVVIGCIVILTLMSILKFLWWETLTRWLLLRWAALGGMAILAIYDFGWLRPRLATARAMGDTTRFDRLHTLAVRTTGVTVLCGLFALFLS